MKRQNNKGFSLVELIIVVAIMAILIGVLAPQLIRYIEKGKVSADTQFCDTMHSAITYALMDHDVQMATDGSTYWINELTKPYPGYTLPLCDINTSPLPVQYRHCKFTETVARRKNWGLCRRRCPDTFWNLMHSLMTVVQRLPYCWTIRIVPETEMV